MKSLIIYAHPWDGSFNHSVLERVKSHLENKGNQVDVIDLNKDNFDPVMRVADLELFSKGEYADKLALDYVKRLTVADELIFIFPIWWYGEPAILKGFYDKVFLKGHTYKEEDRRLVGLLKTHKATILTTATIDEQVFSYLGDPIQNVLAKGILKTVGINDFTWIHCPFVYDPESRKNFTDKIDNLFK